MILAFNPVRLVLPHVLPVLHHRLCAHLAIIILEGISLVVGIVVFAVQGMSISHLMVIASSVLILA
jgi:hypothetical protein